MHNILQLLFLITRWYARHFLSCLDWCESITVVECFGHQIFVCYLGLPFPLIVTASEFESRFFRLHIKFCGLIAMVIWIIVAYLSSSKL